jgi:glycosyltransferase involved in cell wall biosynthesis
VTSDQKIKADGPTYMILIPSLGVGGTEKQVTLLANELKRKLVKLEIVAFRGGFYEEIFKELNLPYSVLSSKRTTGILNKSETWLKGLFLILGKKPTYLDAFLPEAAIFGSLVKLISRGKIKLIVNRRSSVDYRGRHYLASVLDRFASKYADILTVNSLTLKSEIAELDNIDFNKIKLTPNLIQLPKLNQQEKKFVLSRVLCVANFETRKGHIYLLEALKILKERDFSPIVNLVGRGSLLLPLKKFVTDNNLENVFFKTDVDDCHELYLDADLFVSPSLSEGMSNSLLEAMSYAIPCVGTDVSGTREMLEDCGILVQPSNSKELAGALEHILSDAARSFNIGQAGRQRLLDYSENKEMLRLRIELVSSRGN